ncbi:MAG: hypothetical protein ACOC80_00745 [Petrotogales bacterium]
MDIKEVLETYPHDIEGYETLIMSQKECIEKMKEQSKLIKENTLIAVETDALKDENKQFLSNKQKREIETENRLEKNKEYQKLQKELKKLEKDYIRNQIGLSKQKRVFRAAVALTRLSE